MGATHDKLKHHAARGKLQDTRGEIVCVISAFQASIRVVLVTRGDALRACPWLSYLAPLALSYLAPLALFISRLRRFAVRAFAPCLSSTKRL